MRACTRALIPLLLLSGCGGPELDAGVSESEIEQALYDPRFVMGPNSNEWWVEVTADAATVECEIEGGVRFALPRTSWGTFASGAQHVARGTRVRLHAKSSAGELARSSFFAYLEQTPVLETTATTPPPATEPTAGYDPGFAITSRSSTRYFEVQAQAARVDLEIVGGTTLRLASTQAGLFYVSRRIKSGTRLRLHAWSAAGATARSVVFRYLQEAPRLEVPPPSEPAPTPTPTPEPEPTPTPEPTPEPEPTPTPEPTPEPTPVTGADVILDVDSSRDVHAISPFIYGYSGGGGVMPTALADANLPLLRLGGNRLSAYNWENSASNAGIDYGPHSNDDYLCWVAKTCTNPSAPGEATRVRVEAAHRANASILVTVPLIGLVAADYGGPVSSSQVSTRFKVSRARKGSSFSMTPSTTDGYVYQDEYVWWLKQKFPYAATDERRTIMYSLDNEPALWPETHSLIHPANTGYQELVGKSLEHAAAIKDVEPNAVVFGPADYGWAGFENLHNSADQSRYGNFTDYYLTELRRAHEAQGRRLLDVLDLHWYPEARGDGVRITFTGNNTAGVAAARVQAPRSLWDPTYVETSWIASQVGAIRFLPRMRDKIAARYPGTLMAITEYNYGGTDHISGAMAQADVLGVFGREDLFAATYWPLGGEQSFANAAFRVFRNYDGAGARFGDVSVRARASNDALASVYASLDTTAPGRMVVVAINKSTAQKRAALRIVHDEHLAGAKVYQLTGSSASLVYKGTVTVPSDNVLVTDLPPYSVTVFQLSGSGSTPTAPTTPTTPPPSGEPAPTPPSTSSYDPGFRMGANCNEWWVEAFGSAASMSFQIEGGATYALPRTSWGSFAAGMNVKRGTRIRLLARRDDGATAASTYFGFLEGAPALAP